MQGSLKISWQTDNEDASPIIYYINSRKVGEDDDGFKKILQAIEKEPQAEVIIEINQMHGFGGGKLEDQLPFIKRYHELIKALGERKLIYKIF